MDLVVRTERGLVGIEVKAAEMARPQLTRSARSFIEAYGPVRFLVVNLDLLAEEQLGRTQVRWVGPELFADRRWLVE